MNTSAPWSDFWTTTQGLAFLGRWLYDIDFVASIVHDPQTHIPSDFPPSLRAYLLVLIGQYTQQQASA